MFAGAGMVAAAKQGIDELKASAEASSNVEAVIRSTGEAANVTADEIDALAESQLKLTGVDDEAVKLGAAKLLTFKNVKNEVGEGADVFTRATKAAGDLAQVGFGSIESASLMLGKALNDPLKGLTALGRAGVTFSAEQKATIEQLVETGDLLGAQKIILEEVESQVGGAAEAYGKTLPGQMAIAQQSLENTKATIVSSAAPAIELLSSVVTSATETIEDLPGPLRDVATLAVGAGVGIGLIAQPLSGLLGMMATFRNTRAIQASTAHAAAIAEGELAVAQGASATTGAAAVTATEGLVGARGALVAATTVTTTAATTEVAAWQAFAAGTTAAATETTAATGAIAAGGFGAAAALGVASVAVAAFVGSAVVLKQWAQPFSDEAEKLRGDLEGLREAFAGVGSETSVESTTLAFLRGLVKEDRELAGGMKVTDALSNAGVTTGQFNDILLKGRDAFDRWVSTAELSGTVSSDTATGMRLLRDQTEAQAQAALHAHIATGELTQAEFDMAVGANRASDGNVSFVGALDLLTPSLKTEQQQLEETAAAQEAYAEAAERFPGLINDIASAWGEQYSAGQNTLQLAIDYESAIDDLNTTLKDNWMTTDITTEQGRANTEAILAAGEAISALIQQRFLETQSVEAAQERGAMYVEVLKQQLKQAGFTEEQVQEYIDTMNLTPEDINTTFSNNAVQAQLVVAQYVKLLDEDVPPEVNTWIRTLIETGQYAAAQAELDRLAAPRVVDVHLNLTDPGYYEVRRFTRPGEPMQTGGPVKAGWPYIVGEAGRELFVPEGSGTIIPAGQTNAIINRSIDAGATGVQNAAAAFLFVGETMGDGIAMGLEASTPTVVAAAEQLVSDAYVAIAGAVDDPQYENNLRMLAGQTEAQIRANMTQAERDARAVSLGGKTSAEKDAINRGVSNGVTTDRWGNPAPGPGWSLAEDYTWVNPNFYSKRANGGPVIGGEAYLVGERRAEVFQPWTSGQIWSSVDEYEGARRRATSATSRMVDNSIKATMTVVTPDPPMSAVVIGRSLRGIRHRMTRPTA